MHYILNFFLLGDTGPVKGGKQKHAFFKAKSAYIPREGDRLNMHVPTDRIATMDHTDYDRYQGDFVVALIEQTPVFETTDEKAEFPVMREMIVNVYLTRAGEVEVNRRRYKIGGGLQMGSLDHLYGPPPTSVVTDAQRAKNYAAQADAAMHAAMRAPSPMRELLERHPLTIAEARARVDELYTQFPNLRAWVEAHATTQAFAIHCPKCGIGAEINDGVIQASGLVRNTCTVCGEKWDTPLRSHGTDDTQSEDE